MKRATIPNTLSQSWYLGRAVHQARRAKTSYTEAIVSLANMNVFGTCWLTRPEKFDISAGKVLFVGKIVDVQRHVGGGYTMGAVVLAPIEDDEKEYTTAATNGDAATNNKHMIIPFQNEYLYAALCDAAGSESTRQVVCTVPDLISILGQDGEAIGSQDLRYGLRVSVVALPAHPLWKTDKALAVGGPEGFGLDLEPVYVEEEYAEPRSVIEEFGS